MGTLTFEGTGGVIEGNLGTANVNVNLDSTLLFDSNDDKITTGNLGSLGQATSLSSFAWVKLDATPSTSQYIWSTLYAPVNFVFSGANGLRFQGKRGDTDALASVDSSGPFTFTTGDWYHVGFTYDNSSRAVLFYINGVQYAGGTFPAALKNVNADLLLGNYGAGTNMIQGNLADVKIFNSVVSATDAKILAAKINQDPTLTSANANVIGWWKINEGTGTTINDFTNDTNGGTDHNGTLANGTWQYDQYSVDVYDNSTTTDGTFTITQGKVEGLSLTSLDFDGSSDKITSTSFTMDHNGATFAVWVKKSNATGNEDVIIGQASDANQHWLKIDTNGDIILRDYPNDLHCDTAITDTNWHHIVVTLSGDSNGAIYVDGVAQTLSANAIVGDPSFDVHGIRGTIDDFHGKMRDSKVFDYALSAEQVVSLYSGTYPQTPEHNWKMNDGGLHPTGEPYVEDFGTGTDSDGVRTGATWSNGTLDLDGALTIAANGTLSAPRGDLQTLDTIDFNGTFTHNNGTWVPNNTATKEMSCGDKVFYNVKTEATGQIRYVEGYTIENEHSKTSGNNFNYIKNTGTYLYGTTSSAATLSVNLRCLLGSDDASLFATVKGVSSLYPVVFNSWDDLPHNRNVQTGNMKVTNAVSNIMKTGDICRFIGDMEFTDAVTVDTGDTLDLNGQRAEFGNFSLTGTLSDTANGALAYFKGTYTRSGGHSDLTNTITTFIAEGGGTSDYYNPVPRRLFVNTDSTITFNNPLNEASAGSSDFIVAAGTVNANNQNINGKNKIAIGHDATYTAGSSTINCKEDFYTSGGIIGKSSGEFVTDDGGTNHNYIQAGSANNSDNWTNISVETWIKLDHLGKMSSESTFFSRGSNSTPKFGLYAGKLRFYANAASKAFGGTGDNGDVANQETLVTGKWYHVAMTYNNTTGAGKLYVNGKLDLEATIDAGCLTADVGVSAIGAQGAGNRAMDGLMGKISIWNHELTQAEIRELMFMTGAEMQAASNFSSIKNDCKFFYNFDEGSGATIADSGPGGNNGTWAHNNGGTAALWAGAGGFSFGTSTLTMKGSGSQKIYTAAGEVIYALTVNAGSTTDLECIGSDAGSPFMPTHNVTINGTLSSTSVPLYMIDNFVSNGGVFSFGGSADLTGLNSIRCVHTSGTIDIPAVTTKILQAEASGGTTRATGDLTLTSELDVSNGATFNGNGNTINVKVVDVNASTLNLGNTTVNFSVTASGDQLALDSSSTLLTGNTTINGNSSASKTNFYAPADGGYEVVGIVKQMDIQTGGDLTVVGAVIDCRLTDSTANIRQFHHTLDTQQLLDADEGGDDDLKLPRPSLDNALQLQTGG